MLADRYPDDEERGKAMGTALGGLALGVLGKIFARRSHLGNASALFSGSTVRRIHVRVRRQGVTVLGPGRTGRI